MLRWFLNRGETLAPPLESPQVQAPLSPRAAERQPGVAAGVASPLPSAEPLNREASPGGGAAPKAPPGGQTALTSDPRGGTRPRTCTIAIGSSPPGAAVERDGRMLPGQTPLKDPVPCGTGQLHYRVSAPGFKPKDLSVVPDHRRSYTVPLEHVSREVPPADRPRPVDGTKRPAPVPPASPRPTAQVKPTTMAPPF
jgi:hypothetical protein